MADDQSVEELFGTLRGSRFLENSDPNNVIQSTGTGSGNIQPLGGFIADGVVTATTFDTTAPSPPTGLTLSSDVAFNSDGTSFIRLLVGLVQPADADLFASYVEVTAHNDGAEPPNPVWDRPITLFIPKGETQARLDNVQGLTQYWGRARAVDVLSNFSTYTAVETHTTLGDATAPPAPTGVILTAGFRGFAASWTGGQVQDLLFNQYRLTAPVPLQITASLASNDRIVTTAVHGLSIDDRVGIFSLPEGEGTGLVPGFLYWVESVPSTTEFTVKATAGGAAEDFTTDINGGQVSWLQSAAGVYQSDWATATTLSNRLFVGDLTADIPYWFQVRSVDSSQNVVTSLTDSTAVSYLTDTEAGYTDPLGVVPALVGESDIAADSITANMIQVGALDADKIAAGTIRIRPLAGYAEGLLFEDDSVPPKLLGSWTYGNPAYADGLALYDPDDPTRYIVLDNAQLSFSGEGGGAAITADGIDASKITFGLANGGINLIRNSSFELAGFVTVPSSVTFTDDTGTPGWNATYWNSAPTANINTTTVTQLAITSWTA